MDFFDESDHYEDELHEIRPYMYSTRHFFDLKNPDYTRLLSQNGWKKPSNVRY